MTAPASADAQQGAVLSPDDVRTLTEEVWSTFLGHTAPFTAAEARAFTPTWAASVTVKGEWNGMVSMQLTGVGAHRLTCGMLGMDPESDEPSEADVVDAVGELVNMVGGNVKSLVPGPSQLSLPLVATGQFAHGSDQQEIVRLDFAWGDEPVSLTVHSGSPAVSKVNR
ncbi:chemotaxis protein CheX [Nocardioides jishulii]|uniref:Chemotaxis protein CheX n=1 Tax=Nocardioides jishulii TaxID=2575440 RepID=A0A4U2YST3_9ACTN|nr:chemotaxis protein CheX [Nocardioides jishulii]QCX28579.1 chemotaxis protein CheX [Nocardioides jishulii]TKI64528.1 chemotaxis protein CheX [Nocardioides jishulii]